MNLAGWYKDQNIVSEIPGTQDAQEMVAIFIKGYAANVIPADHSFFHPLLISFA